MPDKLAKCICMTVCKNHVNGTEMYKNIVLAGEIIILDLIFTWIHNYVICLILWLYLCIVFCTKHIRMAKKHGCGSPHWSSGVRDQVHVIAYIFNYMSFLVPLQLFPNFVPKSLGTCSCYQRNKDYQYPPPLFHVSLTDVSRSLCPSLIPIDPGTLWLRSRLHGMKRGQRDPKSSQGRARPNVLDPWCSKIMCFRILLPHEGYGPTSSSPYSERQKRLPTRTPGSHHFVVSSTPPSPSHPAAVHPLRLQHICPCPHHGAILLATSSPHLWTPSSHCSTGCKTRSVGPYVLRHRIFSIEPSPSVDYLFFCSFHSCCSVV